MTQDLKRERELSDELTGRGLDWRIREVEPAEGVEFVWCVEFELDVDWDILGAGMTRVEALEEAVDSVNKWDEVEKDDAAIVRKRELDATLLSALGKLEHERLVVMGTFDSLAGMLKEAAALTDPEARRVKLCECAALEQDLCSDVAVSELQTVILAEALGLEWDAQIDEFCQPGERVAF